MALKQRRAILYLIWLLIILSGPITVLLSTPLNDLFSDRLLLLSTLQRMTGLLAYSLLFVQILIGSFLGRWVQVVGSKAYRAHVVQGLLSYGFLFIHPLFQSLIDFQLMGKFTPILIPSYKNQTEIYLNFGRAAFYLFTVGVVAGYFRTKPFFRRNWRVFHVLNYLAFYAVFVHARFIGSDIFSAPFVYVFYVGFVVVTFSAIYRVVVWTRSWYEYLRLNQEVAATKRK